MSLKQPDLSDVHKRQAARSRGRKLLRSTPPSTRRHSVCGYQLERDGHLTGQRHLRAHDGSCGLAEKAARGLGRGYCAAVELVWKACIVGDIYILTLLTLCVFRTELVASITSVIYPI